MLLVKYVVLFRVRSDNVILLRIETITSSIHLRLEKVVKYSFFSRLCMWLSATDHKQLALLIIISTF